MNQPGFNGKSLRVFFVAHLNFLNHPQAATRQNQYSSRCEFRCFWVSETGGFGGLNNQSIGSNMAGDRMLKDIALFCCIFEYILVDIDIICIYIYLYQRKFRLRNFRYTNDISVKLSQVE